ncbi:MAG TPA: hypothetical protein VK578_05960 [Edaphobacter sp.]|nr:hypothetical protein [Edaphobacter sp.]
MPEVYEPVPGEMVAYGLSLENSDFGNGALSIRAYLLRIWCTNLAITQALAGRPLSFGFQIAQRSVTWYADAVRETHLETKLVKCTTAIECLLLAAPRKATATFVIRGALLAQRQQQPMSYWAPIAKRLYQRRSDVVHGNINSLEAATKESSAESMEFTRNVALQFLQFCHALQPLGPKQVGTKDDFLELYRDTEGTFQSEIREIVKTYGFSWDLKPALGKTWIMDSMRGRAHPPRRRQATSHLDPLYLQVTQVGIPLYLCRSRSQLCSLKSETNIEAVLSTRRNLVSEKRLFQTNGET